MQKKRDFLQKTFIFNSLISIQTAFNLFSITSKKTKRRSKAQIQENQFFSFNS